MICDKCCFVCAYPDCINDFIDADDYADLLRIDKMLFPERYTEAAIKERERHAAYEKRRKKTYDPAKRKADYERNKARWIAYQRDYQQVNRDEHNRKRRERRVKEKERRHECIEQAKS